MSPYHAYIMRFLCKSNLDLMTLRLSHTFNPFSRWRIRRKITAELADLARAEAVIDGWEKREAGRRALSEQGEAG